MSDAPQEATRVFAAAPADDATRVVPARHGGASAAAIAPENESPTVLPPGTRVAEFEITRLIGQGGFGVVYEAWDHTLERVVALKEYLPGALATRAANGSIVPLSERQRETFDLGMRSFINEARLLAQFDHPSLVKVYRFWEERGTTYMVMPHYQGRTLRQALAGIAPAPVEEAWLRGIVDGVTQALAVMHAAQCYHRDIAPDNILLLDGSDRPVVLDFGAARRVITDKTQAITVILKPGYAPVEQYAEMPDMKQGAWTDVYALAAVMHVAVTGRVPPPSVGRLLSDSYQPLSQDAGLGARYSGALLATIDAGLAVRPEARPQSMQALRALLGLDAATADADGATVIALPSPARGPGTDHRPPQAAPSVRRTALLASVVLAALVLGGASWWWLAGSSPAPAESADNSTAATAAQQAPDARPASAPDAATPQAAPPPPAPHAAERSPLESLQALAIGATAGFDVTARALKAQVDIGKDQLAFEVASTRDGYAYVFLLDSQGELYLLFPNALDKRNRISAGQKLALPRPAWAMASGGPAGVNRFAVVVSALERDFTQSGALGGGMFAQFPATVLAALEAARGDGPTPLLGRATCPGGAATCADAYGTAYFDITEK